MTSEILDPNPNPNLYLQCVRENNPPMSLSANKTTHKQNHLGYIDFNIFRGNALICWAWVFFTYFWVFFFADTFWVFFFADTLYAKNRLLQ